MKVLSLNIWGGKVFDPLIAFVQKYSGIVDIFCFQEIFDDGLAHLCPPDVRLNIFSDIAKALPEFEAHIAPSQIGGECLAVFIKRQLPVTHVDDFFVFGSRNSITQNDPLRLGRNVQYVICTEGGREYVIANFHGLWNGQGKIDTPSRIEQSIKIKHFLEQYPDKKRILIGDFNLLPETESIKIIEKDMQNLIKDFDITSTRSIHYTKEPKFADYAFVSQDVSVKEFKVLPDEVSDHLALYLDFE